MVDTRSKNLREFWKIETPPMGGPSTTDSLSRATMCVCVCVCVWCVRVCIVFSLSCSYSCVSLSLQGPNADSDVSKSVAFRALHKSCAVPCAGTRLFIFCRCLFFLVIFPIDSCDTSMALRHIPGKTGPAEYGQKVRRKIGGK